MNGSTKSQMGLSISLTLGLVLFLTPGLVARGGGGGSGVGNGGQTIANASGQWILSDPWVAPAGGGTVIHYKDFNANIRQELEIVSSLLVRVGAAVDNSPPESPQPQSPGTPPLPKNQSLANAARATLTSELSRTAAAQFFKTNITDSNINYRFVQDLPTDIPCFSSAEYQDQAVAPAKPVSAPSAAAPAEGAHAPAHAVLSGCSNGPDTYIVADVFRNMPVKNAGTDQPPDPREQVKFILHERLQGAFHALGLDPVYVSYVTNGVDLMLDLRQQELAGARPVLSDAQMDTMTKLIDAVGFAFDALTGDSTQRDEEFEPEDASGDSEGDSDQKGYWHIARNGGGLASWYTDIAKDAYLGVGSLLGDGGQLGSGAEMIDSSCYLVACVLEPGAKLVHSTIAPRASSRTGSPVQSAPGQFADERFLASIGKGANVWGLNLQLDLSPTPLPSGSPLPQVVTIGDEAVIQGLSVTGATTVSVGMGANLTGDNISFEIQDDASTLFTIGDHASVSGLANYLVRTQVASDATIKRQFTVPPGSSLAIQKEPICASPLVPVLGNSSPIVAPTLAGLAGACGSPFPTPPPFPFGH